MTKHNNFKSNKTSNYNKMNSNKKKINTSRNITAQNRFLNITAKLLIKTPLHEAEYSNTLLFSEYLPNTIMDPLNNGHFEILHFLPTETKLFSTFYKIILNCKRQYTYPYCARYTNLYSISQKFISHLTYNIQ